MHHPHQAVAVVAALLGATLPVLALPQPIRSEIEIRTGLPVPADDPFYTPPAGYENEAPGTVLRSRPIVASFFSLVPDPVEAWQVLYTSTAVNGSAITTVTTIFKPYIALLDRFVSYATAYDSAATQCDPSYAYQLGSDASDNLLTDVEFLIIQSFLLQGYVVSSSNYEGPDAAFTPGHLEGMCVLDSLRAVSNFGATLGFVTETPSVVAYGYSGGAIATGWAATLQSSYAPELPVKAWVHGGTPANLTGVLLYIDGTDSSGFLPTALAGLSAPSAYQSQLQPVLDQVLTTEGKEAIAYVQTHCMSDDLNEYEFVSVLSYEFQTLGPAFLQQATVSEVFGDNLMGSTSDLTPAAPVLIFHALQDEIIPYANASALAERYCSRGVDVTFTTYEQGGHITTAFVSLPATWAFVNDAFAGKFTSGCVTTSELGGGVLNPIGDLVELEPIISALENILGSMNESE